MLILATLSASERRRVLAGRKRTPPTEPEPAPVRTSRATIVKVATPLGDPGEGRRWLARAGEDELAAGLGVLNRALHAYRLVSADPYAHEVRREQALVARVGFGAGEQVADGQWTEARELVTSAPQRRTRKMLAPDARFAAILTGREPALACEELALRARLDLGAGRGREAALQMLITLDAALAELPGDAAAATLEDRLAELRAQREPIASAAHAALGGPLSPEDLQVVSFALGRVEAVLRARAAAVR